jgi:phosphate uptake regulator
MSLADSLYRSTCRNGLRSQKNKQNAKSAQLDATGDACLPIKRNALRFGFDIISKRQPRVTDKQFVTVSSQMINDLIPECGIPCSSITPGG